MKRLNSVETSQVQLEVVECDCGYHMGIDATYLDQVDDFIVGCPSCGELIDTNKVLPEDEPKQERYSRLNEHPYYPLSDWEYQVANGDTVLGYNDFVRGSIEQAG